MVWWLSEVVMLGFRRCVIVVLWWLLNDVMYIWCSVVVVCRMLVSGVIVG